MTGRLEVVSGCMFSGKTSELIRRLQRSQDAGLCIKVFKPEVDVRSGQEQILSHDKRAFPAISVEESVEIFEHIDDEDQVIGIDEAQFFSESVAEVAMTLASRGMRVIAAGLDTDWRGQPFGVMPQLMAMADQVDKLTAICAVCGQPARRSHRLVNTEDRILVGDSEYEPRCLQHFSPQFAPRLKVEFQASSTV